MRWTCYVFATFTFLVSNLGPVNSAWAVVGAEAPTGLTLPSFGRMGFSGVDGNLSFELTNSQYLRANEPYFREGASPSLTSWRLGWKADLEANRFFATANLRNDYQSEEEHHYFKPFKGAVGLRTENYELGLGRLPKIWSQADEHWRLGVWQPRFMDDPLTRETAGLTGAFLQLRSQHVRFLAFASPIFIPETGPAFQINRGTFQSQNPWFRPPTHMISLRDTPTHVYFDLDRPSTWELMDHGGGAAQIEVRPRPTRFARVSTAYKPINQLLFGFPLEFHLQDPNFASVTVVPRVLYHQVTTAEIGVQQEGGLTTWLSVTQEHPYRDDPPPEWTTQEIRDATLGSAYLGYDVRGEGEFASHLFLSYMKVQGGVTKDKGQFTGSTSFFEPRYLFTDSVQVGARHGAPWLSSRWLTRLESAFTYDLAQHGIIFSSAIVQKLTQAWKVRLEFDLIGLADQSGSQQTGFMSSYRANDRVSLGVEYVF